MKPHILITHTILIFETVIALTACGNAATASSTGIKILPENCQLIVGQQTSLTLNGQISSNASINWNASDGSIISSSPYISAMFTAPLTPTMVIVTARIISTPGAEMPVTRDCNVMPTGVPVTPPPVNMAGCSGCTDIVPVTVAPTIAITEVMSNVCGGDDYKKYNEYVELYNYGDAPVDVRGWWLYDPGPTGTPDSLIAWSERVSNALPDTDVITNTTVVPSHGFAVILSPLYVDGIAPHSMPYDFPANTVILSIKESERLGDDAYGIVGSGLEPDFLVLYQGGSSSIQREISTYGDPVRGIVPNQYQDTPLDGLPLENIPECWSAKKIDLDGPDEYKNWYLLKDGSPGQASHQ